MTIRISCSSCNRILHVPVEAAGRTGTCPNRGQRLRVPGGRTALANSYSPGQRTTLEGGEEEKDETEEVQSVSVTPLYDEEAPQRPTNRIPIWGTFLILLVVLLSVVGWGSWRLYDTKVRQPRFQAIRQLYDAWYEASHEDSFDQSRRVDLEGQLAELREKGTIQGGLMRPRDVETEIVIRQNALRQLKDYREESLQWAKESDQIARERYGVPAAELPRLLPD